MSAELSPGLYIVAGPIGNLSDLSPRAAEILRDADVIAVEDSRVSARLLRHAGSDRPMVPYHDHSDERVRARLVERMAGEAVALLSDAGTPLISDPGYKLVRDARAAGRMVTSLPGPCAAIAAITLSGLPSDRFLFMGFLPSKTKARSDTLDEIRSVRATLVFYESGPRCAAALGDMQAVLGDRPAALCREISKAFEEVLTGSLSELAAACAAREPRGEIVLVVGPPGERPPPEEAEIDAALRDALARLPVSQAAGEVARALGLDRKALYARAMTLRGKA
ncbi:ribosomal RNA small subunit methyltransferase I [Sphingobium sp. SYK-6]|uniref:16S rRNA (cytidine(1402)-2'-O)-methyltransferase n=1 Tax=Sphingobium sp. (strain NBRC 103272 / SYK-6) TaxID=627192 RepID=UPI0002277E37|nr:16S rRNA (cytidine(1402)-2'-O)-methyltransferase [Sphingobium sp. SYK-6]BAK68399.1 ribosomal RNA small subunit methyltransferase I [Sphingobium sp. SYK-6]